MEFVFALVFTVHLLGMALIVGTFFVQMRAKSGFNFRLLLIGATVQLLSGITLYGLAMADGGDVNHMRLGIKMLVAVIVFVAALVGYLRQRAALRSRATIATNGAATLANESITDRALKPLFHTAGGLALINVFIATLWN